MSNQFHDKNDELQFADDSLSQIGRMKIKLFFTAGQQAAFLRALFMRKQANGERVSEEILIKEMHDIYQYDKALNSANKEVCQVLIDRMKNGYSLGDAMRGVFSRDYCQLFAIVRQDASLTKDISTLFLNMSENKSLEFWLILKMMMGTLVLVLFMSIAIVFMNIVDADYVGNENAYPFLVYPEQYFAFLSVVDQLSWVLLTLLALICVASNQAKSRYLGDYRYYLDRFWPPTVLYRYMIALNLFSNLQTLIKSPNSSIVNGLELIGEYSTPYEKWHITEMVQQLNSGKGGAMGLSTGLLPDSMMITLKMADKGKQASLQQAINEVVFFGNDQLKQSLRWGGTLFVVASILIGVLLAALPAATLLGLTFEKFANL